ncbi:paraquat-inducible protein A [Candidatus Pantoea edessiphila]|uniref:paraquat-inducible protein A n=1 Tax=Candidatus Pantoea edessiphila TaxID=2044610 RepID=UPI001F541AA1|nr:paraquat-inducible protein A [Candidatus Pantoea edessiphila]
MPIMTTEIFGLKYPSNIMEGIILLWCEGYYLISILIFFSIIIPMLKIFSIGWLCWNANGYGNSSIETMHAIYKIIKFIEHWSMIDIFIILILSSILKIGKLIQIYPSSGLILFTLVIIFIMITEMNFDPRLIWDRINNK